LFWSERTFFYFSLHHSLKTETKVVLKQKDKSWIKNVHIYPKIVSMYPSFILKIIKDDKSNMDPKKMRFLSVIALKSYKYI
jgi:hypothetical protein